jgi:hypothetical protein
MLTILLAAGIVQGACPVTIGISRDGSVFSDRFHGWYKVSQKTLKSDLRGGCYNDANPSPVTSVRLELAPGAPRGRVDLIYSILGKSGWPRARVAAETWLNDPAEPR